MRAEEILKECEEDRLCGFEEFDRNEIIMMMNMYAKEAFNAAREKKNQIITMNGSHSKRQIRLRDEGSPFAFVRISQTEFRLNSDSPLFERYLKLWQSQLHDGIFQI